MVSPASGDKRFNDPGWKDEVVFDYLKQSYLLTTRWLQHTVKEVDGVDDKTAKTVAEARAAHHHLARSRAGPHPHDHACQGFHRARAMPSHRRAKPVNQQVLGSAHNVCRDVLKTKRCSKRCQLCGGCGHGCSV